MSFLDDILGNSTSSKNNESFIARLGGLGQKYTDPLAMIFGDKYTGALTKLADKSQAAISKGMKPFEKIDKTINPVRRFVPGVDQLSDNIAQKPVDSAAIVAGMLASGGALSGAMGGGGAGGGASAGLGGWGGGMNSGLGVFANGGAGGMAGVGGGNAGALAAGGGIAGGAGMGSATQVAQPSIAQLMGKGGFGSMPGMSTGVPPEQQPPAPQTVGQKMMGGLGRARDAMTPIDPRVEAQMDPQHVKALRNQAMLRMGLGMMASANQGGRFGEALASGYGLGQAGFNKDVQGTYERGVEARHERRALDRQDLLDKRYDTEQAYSHNRDIVGDKRADAQLAETKRYHDESLKSLERRAQMKAPGTTMTEGAIDFAASRLLNGEPANVVLANFGRGTQGAANITAVQNRFAEMAQGAGIDANAIAIKTQELNAERRTRTELGSREGKIAPRVQEAQNFARIALDASAKVPRDQFLPWNKLKQLTDKQLNDPNLAAFKAATVSLINAYAGAVGGGQMHVHDQQVAESMLNTAQSPEAYAAVVNQLITETEAALDAPGDVMERMRNGHGLGSPPPAPSAPVNGNGWSITPVQ